MAAAVLSACGSPLDEGGAAKFAFPDGDDNLVSSSSHGGVQGALFQAIAASETTVFACTGAHGVQVSRIVNDSRMEVVHPSVTLPEGKGCREATVAADGTVFITGQGASGGSFLATINDSGSVFSGGSTDALVEAIAASDTHVFAAAGAGGLLVFARDAGGLTQIATLSGFDQALGLDLWCTEGVCNRLVVANGLSGVTIVDIADPAAPAISGQIDTHGTARRVVVDGDVAYVAAVAGGLRLVDLVAKKELGAWVSYGSAMDLALTEAGVAYVANLEDVVAVDVTDLGNPVLLASELISPKDGSGSARVVDVTAIDGVGYAVEWSGIWQLHMAPDPTTRIAPDIHLSKRSIDFGLALLQTGQGVIVENKGPGELQIAEVSVNHPDFSVDIGDSVIAPGGVTLLQIKFTPTSEEPVEGLVTLTTNDPDEGTVTIPLSANELDGIQLGAQFDQGDGLTFTEYKTGNDLQARQFPGKVIVLAWFASW